MSRLSGRVALVTGASRGIGRAIAERLARDGASVAVNYAGSRDKAEAVVASIVAAGGKATAIQADVSRHEDVKRLFDETERRMGRPSIVVANAGTFFARPFAEMTEADFDVGFAVNARGSFLTFIEAARRVPEGGRVIGFSTCLTLQGLPALGLYQAGKAAVEQFVKTLAKELGPRRITVNAVAPGPTDTEMLGPARRKSAPGDTPLGRIGRPEEIADVVAFLVSDEAGWVTGQVLGANGGIT
ncbi:SDR family oxidoreductase [Archangium violaceum]|uniref:SDR family oxidoreductase n=1 Tax=Archangium violaceum TaxID=83451 RepID=UPI002B2B3448|nr:SDR family oxidoreductase [Archangium violaceum]